MFTQAKLILQSYKPLKLEKGMWFLSVQQKQPVVYEMNYVPTNAEEYIQLNGYPVEPYLYIQGNPNIPDETFLIASPEQIGWFDEGEHSDDLHDITIKEINYILIDDGWCQVEVEEEHLDDAEAQDDYINIVPVLLENKVTIKYFFEEDEEDYLLEGDDEFDPDDYRCDMCSGTGMGPYDGTSCSFCSGDGINYRGRDDDDDRDYDYYSHYDY